MALKDLDIFKLSPKKNRKECGSPTCMVFSMKVTQGSVSIDACPYFSQDAKATLNEATAPPMKTIKVGTGDKEMALERARIEGAVLTTYEALLFELLGKAGTPKAKAIQRLIR